jgi:hypothetical protein
MVKFEEWVRRREASDQPPGKKKKGVGRKRQRPALFEPDVPSDEDEEAVSPPPRLPPDETEDLNEYRRGIERAADRERRAAEQAEVDAEEDAWEQEQRRRQAEKELAEEAKRRARQEEQRIRKTIHDMHRAAGTENALFNYDKLIGDLLPKLMCVDFELLPQENQHTIVNLLDKTHRYLDGWLYKKPEKQYLAFRWASMRDHLATGGDDDDDDDDW